MFLVTLRLTSTWNRKAKVAVAAIDRHYLISADSREEAVTSALAEARAEGYDPKRFRSVEAEALSNGFRPGVVSLKTVEAATMRGVTRRRLGAPSPFAFGIVTQKDGSVMARPLAYRPSRA